MASAILDNATLAAAEIGPSLSEAQIKSALLGLLISGDMLIPRQHSEHHRGARASDQKHRMGEARRAVGASDHGRHGGAALAWVAVKERRFFLDRSRHSINPRDRIWEICAAVAFRYYISLAGGPGRLAESASE